MKMLSLMLVLTGMTVMAGSRNVQKQFDTKSDVHFALESHKGSIYLRSHNENTVVINAKIVIDDEHDQRLLDKVEIKTHQSGNTVSVEVDYDDKGIKGIFSGLMGGHQELPSVEFEILVPARASLDLESHKSGFDVAGVSGDVTIDSHKGTGTIAEVQGNLHLESHKGKFDVEILEMHNIYVESHKGDIHLRIHNGDNFVIRGQSHKGDLRFSGHDIPLRNDDGELQVNHRIGNGTNRITLETHKGDIRLEFIR